MGGEASARDALLAVIASKAKRPRLGVSNCGLVWVASLSLAMTTSPCSRAVLQRLVAQASTKRNPPERARAKSRFFPRFVSFQGFARQKISPPVSPPPRGACRRRLDRVETPRTVSGADRAPHVSGRRGVPPLEIEILSPFCEFSRLCEVENFLFRRDVAPGLRATGVRPWPKTTTTPIVWRPDALSPRMRASARRRAGLFVAI